MLKYFSSVTCLGILVISCASKNGVDNSIDPNANNAGGTSGFCPNPLGCNNGGAGGAGADAGTAVIVNRNYKGGMVTLTDALWSTINDKACAGGNAEIEPTPALLEFVVDDSGSMLDTAPGTGTKSKWEVTRDALAIAINGDPTVGTTGLPYLTAVGMLFFPNKLSFAPGTTLPANPQDPYYTTPKDVSTCVDVNNPNAMIPVARIGAAGSVQRAALAKGLATAAPIGGTPTDDAYTYAFQNGLLPFTNVNGGYAPYMVLITDGQPTMSFQCIGTGSTQNPVDPQPILDHVTQFWTQNSTKTFVIGSPGSDAIVKNLNGRTWLSDAASAGQTPLSPGCNDTGTPSYCHFDMTTSPDFTQSLTAALKSIIETAIPCSYPVPIPADGRLLDTNFLNVVYNATVDPATGTPASRWVVGQSNPTDPSCLDGTVDGWFIDPATNKIALCPKTCNTVQSDKTATLQIRGGCPPVILFT